MPKRKRAEVPAPVDGGPSRVGTVVLVNEEAGFVLVDITRGRVPTPGAALKTFAGGAETAELRAGSERRRDFVAADIVGGMPTRGDAVFRAPAGDP